MNDKENLSASEPYKDSDLRAQAHSLEHMDYLVAEKVAREGLERMAQLHAEESELLLAREHLQRTKDARTAYEIQQGIIPPPPEEPRP